jgi:hypothetical protein
VCRVTEVAPPRPRSSGSKRGRVRGFSKASRLRLLERIQECDRTQIRGHWATAHTVPAGEADWSRIERHRVAWLKRFSRKWGPAAAAIVWKKEDHKSGWPHLHEIILWLVEPPDLLVYRAWNDVAWAEVVASENPAHVRTGCNVQRVRSWQGVASYASKYLGKEIEESHEETGRIWGIYNRRRLPKSISRRVVSADVGKRVRRAQRKLRQRRRRRTFVRFGGSGPWLPVLPYKSCSEGEAPYVVSVENQLSLARHYCRTYGERLEIRCRLPKCCSTVPVQIWQEVQDSAAKRSRIEPGEVELHAYTSGRHFGDASEARRLVEFFAAAEARRLAVESIPF